jgi:hypothetical protein
VREQSYPAARRVAQKVVAYFARHYAEFRDGAGEEVASLPSAEDVEAIVDAVFWASLRPEEGYVPRITIAFLSHEQSVHPLRFTRPLLLEPVALSRVAPAVERPGIHLGVWTIDGELRVWGTTRTVPRLCLVVEVAAPGLLVIKYRRGEERGKFVNVAVLEGDRMKIVDEHASSLPDCPSLITSMLGFESSAPWAESVNILVQLAVSMRAHGRGGSLLVVPAGADNWRESIAQPVQYAAFEPFCELANLWRQVPDEADRRVWQEELNRTVEAVAGLTAVDGAAVLNTDFALLGFGAKIVRRRESHQVEQVTVTEPIEGDVATLVHPEQLGGTRHLSAAQFVHDQHDAVALVASQDGKFTVFAWSPCEVMVHAHRVDTLLL